MKLRDYLDRESISIADFATEMGVTENQILSWGEGLRTTPKDFIKKVDKKTKGEVQSSDFKKKNTNEISDKIANILMSNALLAIEKAIVDGDKLQVAFSTLLEKEPDKVLALLHNLTKAEHSTEVDFDALLESQETLSELLDGETQEK
ncbi:MAG: hypothetical protein ACR2N8_03010 [Parvibaculales bacterium]